MARKEKQYHFIYKTTNLLNGKYYYGMHSTDNLNDGYYGSGRRLRHSLNKYGKENHKVEIVEYLPNRKSLIDREKEIVSLNEIAKEDCINLVVGGSGGFLNEKHRKKFFDNAKKYACKNGKKGNEKFIELMKDPLWKTEQNKKVSTGVKFFLKKNNKKGFWEGKKHKEESKIKIGLANSISQKGKNNPQYNKCWITNDIESKMIKKDDNLPDGWKYGRKIKYKKFLIVPVATQTFR